MPHDASTIPRIAAVLGYGGVIPFLAAAANSVIGAPLTAEFALRVFVAYGAVILSFLGGIRWGIGLHPDASPGRELTLSVIPSLWAGACLLLPTTEFSVWGLLTGFLAMGLIDRYSPPLAMPPWMRRLRLHLTIAVSLCHAVVILA